VASFVGDTNVLRGRLDRVDGAYVVVAVGAARVKISKGSLQGIAASAPVDLYVRPEHLRITESSEPYARTGVIVAHVYQGGHVDSIVECTDPFAERLLVRSTGHDAMTRWPMGAQVGISISADEGVAFAAL
jgi:ABC-type Fe3+/spermidine/putrescine transport system ATPase subunit